MFVDLKNKPCLVIGGGKVAYRKVCVLLDFEADVTVVAQDFCEEIYDIMNDESKYLPCQEITDCEKSTQKLHTKKLQIKKMHIKKSLVDGEGYPDFIKDFFLVVAATDDKQLNHEIAKECKLNNIMVNAVDQKEDCTFIFSSYVKQQNLVAAFSSGGNSPVIAQYLKEKENEILTPFLGQLNEYMGQIREEIKAKYDTEEERKAAFKEIVERCIKEQSVDI